MSDYDLQSSSEEEWAKDVPPEILIVLRAMMKLARGELDICPRCGKKLEHMEQIGRCVYGSCGCRLYQGRVPEKWRES